MSHGYGEARPIGRMVPRSKKLRDWRRAGAKRIKQAMRDQAADTRGQAKKEPDA